MPTLNWIGKEAVVNHHRQVPYRLLHCDKSRSAGDPESGNLLVQGDNLEALKALLPYYAGKVKCIYIDPPYNTGNESWVYNDNVNSPQIKKWLGKVVGKEADDLTRHDKWLCMMYPRLALLREFLTRDGMIFVSLDDFEIASLRLLMDELFGRRNFYAMLTRRSMHTVRNSSKDFNLNTDYVLVYGADKEWTLSDRSRYIREPADKADDYPLDDKDGKGPYKLDPISARNYYEPYSYTFLNGYQWTAPAGSYPRYSQETLAEMDRAGEIVFRRSGPVAKRYLANVQEGRPPDTLLDPAKVGFNKDGTSLLADILGGGTFAQPKPVQLITHLLSFATDSTSLVLDSFAGSGTTGHAVLQMNKADGGNRRFICIELDEAIARDVTSQRLKKVVEGYKNAKGEAVEPLGGGFRFCTLGKPLLDEFGNIDPDVKFADLAAHVFFAETGSPLPKRTSGQSPLVGTFEGRAIYLLFNGILGDKKPNGGNVLTGAVLESLPEHDGTKVIYGEACRLGESRLQAANVVFKQVPWEVSVG